MTLFQHINHFFKRLILIIIVLLPTTVIAKTLKVIVGLERPPYILQAKNSGYELDLLSEVIELMGYDVKYIYAPYGRTLKLLSESDIDGITTMTVDTEPNTERLTDTYVTYQNSVVSLAEKKLNIRQLSDLNNVGVISFDRATELLGKEYHNAVVNNDNYIEVAQTSTQVKLLLKNRVDCIVIDKNIFGHLKKKLGMTKSVVFHNILPPTDYQMVFKDPKLILSFNKYLSVFKTSARYLQLKKKYLRYSI